MSLSVAELRALDRRALDLTGAAVAAVRPADLDRPTPCPPWRVADLLRHLVSQNLRFAAAARGEDPDAACPYDGGDLGDDPAGAYRDSADRVTAAFAAPDIDARRIALPELFRPVPAPAGIGFHVTDYVVHAWDVAASVGAPLDPPADLVTAVLPLLEQIPDGPPVRGPGGPFAARIPVPDSAPPYHRVLAITGRDPAWRP
jgi:uncharacterized protein (TIGR03086 family)